MKQLTTLFLLMALTPFGQAADIEKGKVAHEAKCMACHDNSIYTRANSIIHSYSSLQNRVKFCDVAAQANLSEVQIDNIIAYLNESFYKFKQD